MEDPEQIVGPKRYAPVLLSLYQLHFSNDYERNYLCIVCLCLRFATLIKTCTKGRSINGQQKLEIHLINVGKLLSHSAIEMYNCLLRISLFNNQRARPSLARSMNYSNSYTTKFAQNITRFPVGKFFGGTIPVSYGGSYAQKLCARVGRRTWYRKFLESFFSFPEGTAIN